MVKKKRTKAIEQRLYADYFKKAQDFYEAVELCMAHGNWNAVGLNAVHCAISATDGLLAKYAGLRSIDPNHGVAADLLSIHITDSDAKKQANRLSKILGLKNLIEYEGRNFTQKEANDLQRDIDRFYNWASQLLTSG